MKFKSTFGIIPERNVWHFSDKNDDFLPLSVKMTLQYRVNEDTITQLYPLASDNDSIGFVLDNYDD